MIQQKIKLASIIANHNRLLETRMCLAALFSQSVINDEKVELTVVLVDDGSTDGSLEMLAEEFPQVRVIRGTGDWYWAKSMACAESATNKDFEYLLWLNNDVVLDTNAIDRMLGASKRQPRSVIVGETRSSESERVTYGGRIRKRGHPLSLELIASKGASTQVDAFHGNVVLIPKDIHDQVGKIDGRFAHAFADDDYSYRVRAKGFTIHTTDGPVAVCEDRSAFKVVGFRNRFVTLFEPKGLPLKSQIRFMRRHGGKSWPIYVLRSTAKRLFF